MHRPRVNIKFFFLPWGVTYTLALFYRDRFSKGFSKITETDMLQEKHVRMIYSYILKSSFGLSVSNGNSFLFIISTTGEETS